MAKIIKIPSVYVLDTKVVGVSKDNSDGTSRQLIILREVLEDDVLNLELEPDNAYDPNAVKVMSKFGHQIGYLGRDVAERVKMAMQNDVSVKVVASWVSGEKYKGVGLRIELVN